MFVKQDLIRVARILDGEFCIDYSGKINGRGAYLCKSKNCLQRCKKIRGLEHSFKSKSVSKIYEELENEFEKSL